MKRIILCADGTWNVRDQEDDQTGRRMPTNVTKVARTIRSKASDGIDQVVCYVDGVGTGAGLDKFTGGAFGDGVCKNVVELYRFIVYNYVDGDEIYLFGFSRGAFTVRTLVGFMSTLGLLQKDDDYYVPDVFALYEKNQRLTGSELQQRFPNLQGTGCCPPIRFVGVWDTVGSLGAPGFLGRVLNGGKYKFHDVSIRPEMQNAYHALAIDEHRVPFEPTLWERPRGWTGALEQVWFAGVHSNIGGGYRPDGLANEALHWIVEKSEALGLEFDKPTLAKYRPCFNSVLKDSMTLKYKVFGVLLRPIGKALQHGEAVHRSVIDRWNHGASAYQPENLKPYMSSGVCTLPVVDTTRLHRGTPC